MHLECRNGWMIATDGDYVTMLPQRGITDVVAGVFAGEARCIVYSARSEIAIEFASAEEMSAALPEIQAFVETGRDMEINVPRPETASVTDVIDVEAS